MNLSKKMASKKFREKKKKQLDDILPHLDAIISVSQTTKNDEALLLVCLSLFTCNIEGKMKIKLFNEHGFGCWFVRVSKESIAYETKTKVEQVLSL